MLIGVPKEIKANENRVGMTPGGVAAMVQAGHHVFVETKAGIGSGFSDDEYSPRTPMTRGSSFAVSASPVSTS